MSFGSPKGIYYLNPMRYQGTSIENMYFDWPLSIVNQSIGIYDHIKVSLIGKNLLLILVQTQYLFNI